MKISIEILNRYRNNGLLYRQDHPDYDLYIWNYTPEVQYKHLWDDVTKMCRGLITDGEGNIIAHCLPKFFNWEELKPEEIPNESFVATEKMDGSFGNIFYYDNKWLISSRGSFTSDQAIKGAEILTKCNTKYGLIPGWNYIVEIIYPENRIVVNYGDVEKLVVITVFNVETGKEGSIDNMPSEGWEIVKKYDGINDFNTLKNNISNDREGYVIRFKSGFRMKIKGEEYIRLHRIITNISTRVIWEYLKEGNPITDLIENVPDEFYEWVRREVYDLELSFCEIECACLAIYSTEIKGKENRKEVAEIVLSKDKRYHGILFAMYDGKPYDKIIWHRLYPEYSKPFYNEKDA